MYVLEVIGVLSYDLGVLPSIDAPSCSQGRMDTRVRGQVEFRFPGTAGRSCWKAFTKVVRLEKRCRTSVTSSLARRPRVHAG